MLSSQGFDLWADGYDKSVGISDEDHTYPFAGYKQVLNDIYQQVMKKSKARVLDIGFGTGTLTTQLYRQGCRIYGVDFSECMYALCHEKMPEAALYRKDFRKGLPVELMRQSYDFILATYSLHHLTDAEKIPFLQGLLPLLKEDGRILIGDVAFSDRQKLEACRAQAGEEWDDEEFYFVFDELEKYFPGNAGFRQISYCAGVLELWKERA